MMWRRATAALDATRLTRVVTAEAADEAYAAADNTVALRKSRRCKLERLQKRDQRPLVVVTETRLLAEVARTEVVSLVDHQILALADGQHVVGHVLQRDAEIVSLLQFRLQVLQQPEQLLPLFRAFGFRQIGTHQIHVREQPDGRAFRK